MPDRTPPAVLDFIASVLVVKPSITADELKPDVENILSRTVSLRTVRDYLATARRRTRTPRPAQPSGRRVWIPALLIEDTLRFRAMPTSYQLSPAGRSFAARLGERFAAILKDTPP